MTSRIADLLYWLAGMLEGNRCVYCGKRCSGRYDEHARCVTESLSAAIDEEKQRGRVQHFPLPEER